MKVGPRRPLAPDADVIRALAGLLSETGLSEIEYAVGDHRIRVARESASKAVLVNGHANGGKPMAATQTAAGIISGRGWARGNGRSRAGNRRSEPASTIPV